MPANPIRKFLRIALWLPLLATPLHAADPTPTEVITEMKRVADWQLAHPTKWKVTEWHQAPFYLGLFNLQQVSGEAKYMDALKGFGEACQWGPGPIVTHADDHAVLQSFLEAGVQEKDQAKIAKVAGHFPKILAALKDKPAGSIAGGSFTWCWCDALYMSPPVWVQLSNITGDPGYRDWAIREWWTTTDQLYDPQHCLYYRDNRFFPKRTETGKKVFWSRGNGWVVGGLVHVLNYLPADHPDRSRFLGLYHDMMFALLKLQHADGLWRSSLLECDGPNGESSGTAFFTYAMAWGLNRGLLPADTFRPAVLKGWRALCGNIQPTGMLGFVQRVDDGPAAAGPDATEIYGAGAFLQAGSEIVRMFDPSKRRKDLASFKGVELPSRYLRATPRAFARFVPERADDFAWENDLIACRTYGPALRAGPEDSGIDIWLKRVPWPIIDKWYHEDRVKVLNSKGSKSYHEDHGEGYDAYKVGDSRGCGGISIWRDGQPRNSDTFIAHRMIEDTPRRVAFELDYASTDGDHIVRETRRITVVAGQRLFQCESRFTIDGKAAAIPVAIGLKPQAKDTVPVFAKDKGTMWMWETVDGLGLGTGIAVDPQRITGMITHTDPAGQVQALCLATTDKTGYIRWFSGYGWEGQGEITTGNAWQAYLGKFAGKFLPKPFADNSSAIKTHGSEPPVAAPLPPPVTGPATAGVMTGPKPLDGVAGAYCLKPNGGWCWYQDPRVIMTRGGVLVFTTIAGDTYADCDAGDLWATSYNPKDNSTRHFELHDKFQRDDHNVAGLLERPDGRILAVYGKHGTDKSQRWRITGEPGDVVVWSDEKSIDAGAGYTYANVFRLSAENGRIYNFHRGFGYNPNCTISDDNGESWAYGWRLLSWTGADLKNNPRATGIDGGRPYLRYTSNNTDAIHFAISDDHPRAYDNSIYHGFYKAGKLHDSSGKVVGDPGLDKQSPLKPNSFTEVFRGDKDHVAWTTDIELDAQGHPYMAFSVQRDGAATRTQRAVAGSGQDHRYHYARFDGKQWTCHELAHAGSRLYAGEDDYTGLVALDPQDPNTVVISTNVDPVTGTPLVSKADGKSHWELFRGVTANGGASWKWQAITSNSPADNLRPIIPSIPGGPRYILWGRGDLKSFTDYRLDICVLAEAR